MDPAAFDGLARTIAQSFPAVGCCGDWWRAYPWSGRSRRWGRRRARPKGPSIGCRGTPSGATASSAPSRQSTSTDQLPRRHRHHNNHHNMVGAVVGAAIPDPAPPTARPASATATAARQLLRPGLCRPASTCSGQPAAQRGPGAVRGMPGAVAAVASRRTINATRPAASRGCAVPRTAPAGSAVRTAAAIRAPAAAACPAKPARQRPVPGQPTCKTLGQACASADQCCSTDHTACAFNNVVREQDVCCSTLGGACKQGGPSGDCCCAVEHEAQGQDYAYSSERSLRRDPGQSASTTRHACRVSATDVLHPLTSGRHPHVRRTLPHVTKNMCPGHDESGTVKFPGWSLLSGLTAKPPSVRMSVRYSSSAASTPGAMAKIPDRGTCRESG